MHDGTAGLEITCFLYMLNYFQVLHYLKLEGLGAYYFIGTKGL